MSLVQAIGLSFLPNIGGFLGSFSTRNQIKTWYERIDKPAWRPPNWVAKTVNKTIIIN